VRAAQEENKKLQLGAVHTLMRQYRHRIVNLELPN
jgi:hypothetical protein